MGQTRDDLVRTGPKPLRRPAPAARLFHAFQSRATEALAHLCTQDLRKSEEARKDALRASQEARVARDMAAERATRLAEELEASHAAEAAALKQLAAEAAAREEAVRRLAGEATAKAAALRTAATEKVRRSFEAMACRPLKGVTSCWTCCQGRVVPRLTVI